MSKFITIKLTRNQAEIVWREMERIEMCCEAPSYLRETKAIAKRIRKAIDRTPEKT